MRSMKRIVVLTMWLLVASVALAQQWPRTVMCGDFEDPTMVRDGKDFYMTHSSFYDYPAFLIWHSTDLMNWTPLCRVVEDAWSGVAMRPLLQKEADGRFSLCFEVGDSLYRYEAEKPRGPWQRVSVSDAKGRKNFHDVFGAHKVVRVNDAKGQDYVVYHEALKGYGSFGLQTMVEPVKKDGGTWKSMADELNRKNRKRNGGRFWRESSTKKLPEMRMRMNDNFTSKKLGLQWSLWGESSMNSVKIERGTLHLTACGKSPADGRKLMTKAIDKNYLVQVQVVPTAGNWSGLTLYADSRNFCGVLTDGKEFVIYQDGREKVRKKNPYKGKNCYLRMVSHRQRVRVQVSENGKRWETLEQGMDVSDYSQTGKMGGMAVRPGLVSCGQGEGMFRKFRYAVK